MSGSPGAVQAVSRPDLRNAVIEEWNLNGEQEMYVADQIAGRVDVQFASGMVRRIPREAYTKQPGSVHRGPAGEYAETLYTDENFTYATQERGLQQRVDHNIRTQTKLYYDAEVVAARMVLGQLKRAHELEVAATVFNTTTWTGTPLTLAAAVPWTTAATGVPVSDAIFARSKVRANCGRNANSIIMTWLAFEKAIETAQVQARITGGATADMPARAKIATLSNLLQLNVIIAGGIKDSAAQGQAFAGASMWDDTLVMVAYLNPRPGLFDINLVNVYNWEEDGGSYDWTVESFYDQKLRGDYVRARRQVGVKAEYPECGFLLTTVTA